MSSKDIIFRYSNYIKHFPLASVNCEHARNECIHFIYIYTCIHAHVLYTYVYEYISTGSQRWRNDVTEEQAPWRPSYSPLPRQQRPNIASPIWKLMNQLHVIGPPPSRNDCLSFLGCFKDSRYANNGLDEERCNCLHSIGIESRF